MLDNRMTTFLKLCDTMNYRIAAEELNLTQPAVTQQIQSLERAYSCKLFIYNKKKLIKTKEAGILQSYAKTAEYNERAIRNKLLFPQTTTIRVGATKTIGNFAIQENLEHILANEANNLSLFIENTETLLGMIDRNELDFALIEGFFDKGKYGHRLFREEPFIGICSSSHPFCDKEITIHDIFDQTIIIREQGSGTKAILAQTLQEYNYSIDNFKRQITISSFDMIKKLVARNHGISFVYKAVIGDEDALGTFTLKNHSIIREFNYVFLHGTTAEELVEKFEV